MELPPVIRIEPAATCNLRCSHCPTGTVRMRRGVMSQETFDRVLAEVAANVPPIRVAVLYHGGEPFLNPRFLTMAATIKATGIPLVKTVSNGMLLRDPRAIVSSGLDELEVSLDGISPAENDRVRVNGDYARVVANVRALATENERQGSPLRITIATTQFRNREAAPAVPDHLRASFAGCDVAFRATWALQWPCGEPFRGYDVDWHPTPAPSSCSLLDDTLTVRASGEVVPCCYDLTTMVPLGNVADRSLVDIWNGEEYRRFRSDFAVGSFPALCTGCAVVTGPKYLVPRADALVR